MVEREWLTLREAAERLGETEDRVRAIAAERRMDTSAGPGGELLIDLEDLATYVELGVYDNAIERGRTEAQAQREAERARDEWLHPAREARKPGCARQAPAAGGAPEPQAHPRIESNGNVMVTTDEAREILHLGQRSIHRLLTEGRLNGFKQGRLHWVYLDEVESYARAQARWHEQGGRWTIYGPQPKKTDADKIDLQPVWTNRKPEDVFGPPVESGPSLTAGMWVTTREAADRLGISAGAVRMLIGRGCLSSMLACDPPGPILRLRPPRRRPRRWLLLDDVLERADRVSMFGCGSGWTPARWRHDLRHPVVRTEMTAPPGDRLITTQEAASILGVHRGCLGDNVRRGRLFVWQKQPGVHGSRAFFSERQILRFANDPVRLKQSAAYHASLYPGAATEGCSVLWPESYYPDGCPDGLRGLRPKRIDEPSTRKVRAGACFYTTRQAAVVLGCSMDAVDTHRRRGRLVGYRHPKRKWQGAGNNWWFYRKEDVHALQADPAYARRHAAGRKAAGTRWSRES